MRVTVACASLITVLFACSFTGPEAVSTTGTESTTDGTATTDTTIGPTTTMTSSGTESGTEPSTDTSAEPTTSTAEPTETSTETAPSSETEQSTDSTGPECPDNCLLDGLLCDEDCALDFSSVSQWYCTGTCSPLGAEVGALNCDVEDADLFCQLLTGDPASAAVSWAQSAVIAAPGFCCLGLDELQVDLGPIPDLGIEALCYQETPLTENAHEFGYALLASEIECG